MKQLFVSYASENKATVDELARRFPRLGYQAWIDSTLHGGQSWWDEIVRQIANCDVFVFVVSGDSLKSVACARELKWALELGKPVLPVAIEPRDGLVNALPPELARVQLVDWAAPSPDSAIELAGALMALPPAPALPGVLPAPPPAPLSYLNEIAEQVSQDGSLSPEQQREILVRLQPGLDSADLAENKAATFLLDKFSRRDDLCSDVDRMLRALAPAGATITGPPATAAPPATAVEPPERAAAKRFSRPLVLALVFVVLVASGLGLVLTKRCEIWPRNCGPVPPLVDAAGTIGRRVPLTGAPMGLARVGDQIWVANEKGLLSRIGRTGAGRDDTPIEIPESVQGLAAGKDRVWVWNGISVIPVYVNGTLDSSGALKPEPPKKITGIAAADSDVWAALGDGTVVRLNGGDRPVFSGGTAPLGIAYAGGKLWIVDPGESKVHQIDPSETKGTSIFPEGVPVKVDAATGGIDAAGDTVYVTTGNGATVTHIADRPLERGIPISVGSGGVYAGDGQGIWVASSLPKGHGTLRYIAEDQTQSRGQAIDLGDLKPVKLLADDDRVWLLATTPDKTRGELVEVVPNELKRQTG